LTGSQCCAGANIDNPSSLEGASCSVPCGPGGQGKTFTIPLDCNAVGSHTVYVYALAAGAQGYETRSAEVTIVDPPAPTCPQFDLVAAGQRVITHQYSDAFGVTVPYPPGQTTDGQIKISLKPRLAPAGTVIYLKVIDPPDDAAYGAPHQADDNLDTNAGTLSGSSKTTSVTLPPAGTADVTLTTTQYASGDNYQVEASADPNLASDPNFVCDPNNGCRTTPVITVWKRMYVEEDEMYRNSQLVASRSLVGDSVVYVNDRGFRKGDNVRLIHAPSFTRTADYDVDGFYSEDRTIIDVARNHTPNQPGAYAVTLDQPLTRPYFVDALFLTTQLADAIVDLSRNAQNSADPLYHSSDQYLAGAFGEAFVEVIKSSSSGVGLPSYPQMTQSDMTFVGGKWFAARESILTPSNFGLVVAAASRDPVQVANATSLGTTAGKLSYVWRQTIDDLTSAPKSKSPLLSHLDPEKVGSEVLVHEVAHQWAVNPNSSDGHCNKMSYANPAKYCQMNSPQATAQYDDGIVEVSLRRDVIRDCR
jgi:hypothetical protein